jgi:UDP-N-acetylglucosamine 2-epimerase (non-hydrolysing)
MKIKPVPFFMSVVGARPNFMKIAPITAELRRRKKARHLLVHTGQHYDFNMSESFFRDLGIPAPDLFLEAGSGSHAEQTAKVMAALEKVLIRDRPDLVIVVGDVNSTMAAAITAAKLGIRVAHVEAGLRSFDRTMPEEINRTVTDVLSDFLFVSERSGLANLRREGVDGRKVHFVGNVMIDSLRAHLPRARALGMWRKLGLAPGGYALLTLHRPSNVDDPEVFGGILEALARIARLVPVVFPVHPRTRKRIGEFDRGGLFGDLAAGRKTPPGLYWLDPVGYLEFLSLQSRAGLVLTDSGGIQEETTVLGVPCLTLRENTERPVTVKEGTNVIVGVSPERIVREAEKILGGRAKKGRVPGLWDGRTARRIVDILLAAFDRRPAPPAAQRRGAGGPAFPGRTR